jgi:hypothetical protein
MSFRRSGRARSFVAVFLAILGLVSIGGCGAPEDLEVAQAELVSRVVAGPQWRAAPAGCEEVHEAGLVLAACDGEPALGALVDAEGRVRCVDALGLLVTPTRLSLRIDPRAGDPSPQPNTPLPYALDAVQR